MVFPMGKLISLIRSHIRHGQDGLRLDTPGASLGTLTTTLSRRHDQVNKICYKKTQVVVTID